MYRQIFEAFSVPLINCLFLRNVIFEIVILTSDHTCNYVAHTVIISDFFVLIPRGIFTRLGGPFTGFICRFKIIGQKASARGSGDYLISVIADCRIISERTALLSVDGCSHCFCGIFDQKRSVSFTDFFYNIYASRESVQLGIDNKLYVRIHLKRFFKCVGIHIPRLCFGVNENGNTSLIYNGIQRSGERHIRTKYAFSLQSAVTDRGLSVKNLTCVLDCKMKRCGATRKSYSVFHLRLLGSYSLYLVNILPHRAHPIAFICFGDVSHFITVHGGRGKPNFIFE